MQERGVLRCRDDDLPMSTAAPSHDFRDKNLGQAPAAVGLGKEKAPESGAF
jgi:hypothetical protein